MRTIPEFPNYLIDMFGTIYSKQGNLKSICNDSNGYKIVQLWKNNKPYMKLVHRLVLETFIGKCPKGMQCCHNDSNKCNNRFENLRWDTPKNNHADTIKRGTHACLLKGEKSGGAKLTNKQVQIIRGLGKHTNLLHKQIAEIFFVNQSTVTRIINKTIRI